MQREFATGIDHPFGSMNVTSQTDRIFRTGRNSPVRRIVCALVVCVLNLWLTAGVGQGQSGIIDPRFDSRSPGIGATGAPVNNVGAPAVENPYRGARTASPVSRFPLLLPVKNTKPKPSPPAFPNPEPLNNSKPQTGNGSQPGFSRELGGQSGPGSPQLSSSKLLSPGADVASPGNQRLARGNTLNSNLELNSRKFDDAGLPEFPMLFESSSKENKAVGSARSSGGAAPAKVTSPGQPIPADEPKIGESFYPDLGHPSELGTQDVPYSELDFNPDPFQYVPFDPFTEMDVYQGKHMNPNQRPLLELGRPFYQLGQLPPSQTFLGRTNLVHPKFQIFGDFRTALGFNGTGGDFQGVLGAVLNLEFDLRITSTERFHARIAPLDRAGQVTRMEFEYQDTRFINNTDLEFDTGFFEGDLGALVGGMIGEVQPFDLPVTVGAIPLLYQNGIWMDDAFIGLAAAIPARNSPRLDISNYDVVFFWGFDNVTSPAFQGNDNAAKLYGMQFFMEMLNGYVESGYAYLEDRTALDRSYHNMAVAYTRRYGSTLSNSVRLIANAGQDPNVGFKTANGTLLLIENSLITRNPSRVIPYFNFFAGFGSPQAVARAGNTGGLLKNTGINFETDGVTGFPTLDATGNNTWGGAAGLNLLAPEFSQQLVLEAAFLDPFGDAIHRSAQGRQYAIGARYQLPISNAVIFRADAMHGIRQNEDDLTGVRVELRHKF